MKKTTLIATIVGVVTALVVGGSVVLADEPETARTLPDLTELRERVRGTVQDWLGTAIEEGTVTEEQAERLSNMADRFGQAGGGKTGGMRGRMPMSEEMQALTEAFRADSQALVADMLDMTVEDLEAAREAGEFDLAAAAEAAGTDEEAIKEALTALLEERVAGAVEDGTITQEQADRILAAPLNVIKERVAPGERPEIDQVVVDWLTAYREANQEDIEAAREAARADLEAAVNAAVEAGELTQEQADMILERGILQSRGMMGGMRPGMVRDGPSRGIRPGMGGDDE